jgi:hypothetical protein
MVTESIRRNDLVRHAKGEGVTRRPNCQSRCVARIRSGVVGLHDSVHYPYPVHQCQSTRQLDGACQVRFLRAEVPVGRLCDMGCDVRLRRLDSFPPLCNARSDLPLRRRRLCALQGKTRGCEQNRRLVIMEMTAARVLAGIDHFDDTGFLEADF